jgi:SNF2 family DNA or RNA helicase
VFRLAFGYNPDLVQRAKDLPFSTFDRETKTWTTRLCDQSVNALRRMWHEGLVDVGPDQLLHEGEEVPEAREAVLRRGTGKRPYYVHFSTRGSSLFPAFRSIPGSQWEKKAGALSFTANSVAALADMVERGSLDDPEGLLEAAGVTVMFDGRSGEFTVRGDGRAAAVFHTQFPKRDVVAEWQAKGLNAAIFDDYTRMLYRGELARVGEGFQPEGLKFELMPFQKQTVAMALERPGIGVYSEPGLGKTIVGIATGYELANRNEITRTVVVVPAAVRTQWEREILKFTHTRPEDIVVVRGDKKKREAAYAAGKDAKWFIVHYDMLSRDKELLSPLFDGAFVIADEAHRLKNPGAARTAAMHDLCRTAKRRMALTGTPVETHPGEWVEILSGFAVPGCLGSTYENLERYRWKRAHGGFEGAKNVNELRARSKMFFIRFTKAEVAKHLPPLRVQTTALDPTPAYEAALRRAHQLAAKELREAALTKAGAGHKDANGTFKLVDEALAGELKDGASMTAVGQLRLLCSSPRLINAESAAGKTLLDAGVIPDEDGPKVDEIRTIAAELLASQQRRHEQLEELGRPRSSATAEEVNGERLVLFTFSKRMANLLADRLAEDGVPLVLFTGDTKSDDRDAAVAAFQDPASDVIAFIATDAAAEGLNLGACCSSLINVDLPWTPSRLAQRSQRIHRLDGKAPAYSVTNFVISQTMELGVLRLLEARSELSDTLLGESGSRRATQGARVRSTAASFAAQALEEYTGAQSHGGGGRPRKPPAKKAASDAPPPLTDADEPVDYYNEAPPYDPGFDEPRDPAAPQPLLPPLPTEDEHGQLSLL